MKVYNKPPQRGPNKVGLKKLDITKIQGPIYTFQKNHEKPRHYYFLELYYDTDTTQTQFIKSFEGLKKGDKWSCNGRHDEITLKFNPPAQRTMRDWAAYLCWEVRKSAYWEHIFKGNQENRRKKIEEFFGGFTDDIIDSSNRLRETEEEIDDDYQSKPHLKADGKSSIANARTKNLDMLFKMGGISDAPSKIEIDADVEAGVETNLNINDNHALATVQAMFMRPEFIQMNKELMDKTADELEKQRNNSDG